MCFSLGWACGPGCARAALSVPVPCCMPSARRRFGQVRPQSLWRTDLANDFWFPASCDVRAGGLRPAVVGRSSKSRAPASREGSRELTGTATRAPPADAEASEAPGDPQSRVSRPRQPPGSFLLPEVGGLGSWARFWSPGKQALLGPGSPTLYLAARFSKSKYQSPVFYWLLCPSHLLWPLRVAYSGTHPLLGSVLWCWRWLSGPWVLSC